MSIVVVGAHPDEGLGSGASEAMSASRGLPSRSCIAASKAEVGTKRSETRKLTNDIHAAEAAFGLKTNEELLNHKTEALGSHEAVVRHHPHPLSAAALRTPTTVRAAQSGANIAEVFETQVRRAEADGKVYATYGKRILDVVLACLIGLLSLPAGLLAVLLVWLDDGNAALFRQQRLGVGGESFTIFKFRSMAVGTRNVASAYAAALPVTRAGRFLRRTSLDEIPQLWNVIRGDMSLVGPRPALPSQVKLKQMRAASGAIAIRPGLTGLAQVNGYDGMSEQEKAAWDARYAASVSLTRDITILLRTVLYLLKPPPRY